ILGDSGGDLAAVLQPSARCRSFRPPLLFRLQIQALFDAGYLGAEPTCSVARRTTLFALTNRRRLLYPVELRTKQKFITIPALAVIHPYLSPLTGRVPCG